jgi:hypothetical protein
MGTACRSPLKKPEDCKSPAAPLDLKTRTATQSSEGWGGKPQLAIDGKTSGNFGDSTCTHTQNDDGAWWQGDLGEIHEICKLVIYNRADCCVERNNNLQVKLDDQLVGTILTAQLPSNTVETKCARGRVLKVQQPTAQYLTLCEVQVYGALFDEVSFLKAEKKKAS